MRAPAKIYLANERFPYHVKLFNYGIAICNRIRGRKRIVIIINFNTNKVVKEDIESELDIKKVIFKSKI